MAASDTLVRCSEQWRRLRILAIAASPDSSTFVPLASSVTRFGSPRSDCNPALLTCVLSILRKSSMVHPCRCAKPRVRNSAVIMKFDIRKLIQSGDIRQRGIVDSCFPESQRFQRGQIANMIQAPCGQSRPSQIQGLESLQPFKVRHAGFGQLAVACQLDVLDAERFGRQSGHIGNAVPSLAARDDIHLAANSDHPLRRGGSVAGPGSGAERSSHRRDRIICWRPINLAARQRGSQLIDSCGRRSTAVCLRFNCESPRMPARLLRPPISYFWILPRIRFEQFRQRWLQFAQLHGR